MLRDEDVFLKKSFPLYNNIAILESFEGRLKAELIIDPYPLLQWDFESLGKGRNFTTPQRYEGNIAGYEFELQDAIGSLTRIMGAPDSHPHGFVYNGSAPRAWVGNQDIVPDRISFFLPNTRCLVVGIEGSLHSDTYHVVYRQGEKPDLKNILPNEARIGAGWDASIGDGIRVSFYFTKTTESWLKSEESLGTFLCAKGYLHKDSDNESTEEGLPRIDLTEAETKIRNLCWLLSFANGGYLGPLLINASSFQDKIEECMIAGAYRTTPIELLGPTWVTAETDLEKFISCLPDFERMIQNEPWNTVYELVLIWYLQVIQPNSAQEYAKPWPVVANVLGAALERLSVAILADELGGRTGGGVDRIKNLLRKLGVINANDDERYADIFQSVRNDATHPRKTGTYTDEDLFTSLQYATLWVEESLLWRLGYDGKYRRRIPGSTRFAFEKPRYDLGTRLQSW